jgi:hypothetical protein
MKAVGIQPGSDTLERVIAADSVLTMIKTDQPEVLVEQFRHVARRSGQSVYVWYPDKGLRSLREGDVRVPGCRGVGDTFRYVMQSMHFGIYIMVGVRGALSRAEQTLLRQLEHRGAEYVRRIVLLGNDEALMKSVEAKATMIETGVGGGRPRLRDGRWVV